MCKMERKVFKLIWLFTVELFLPVWAGSDVIDSLQRADYRLSTGFNREKLPSINSAVCVEENCNGLFGRDLMNCLQTYCKDVGDAAQKVLQRRPAAYKECVRYCQGRQGGLLDRKTCILNRCWKYAGSQSLLNGLHKIISPERPLPRDGYDWSKGGSDLAPEANTSGLEGSHYDEEWSGGTSSIHSPGNIYPEEVGSVVNPDDKGADCESICLIFQKENYQSCVRNNCRHDDHSPPSTSGAEEDCIRQNCEHAQNVEEQGLCAQQNCNRKRSSLEKRWGTRMCMESKCKHTGTKVEYFLCGKMHCHGANS